MQAVRSQESKAGKTFTVLEVQIEVGPARSRGTGSRSSNGGNELFIDSCIFEPTFFGNFAPPGTQAIQFFPVMPKWRRELAQDSQCDCLDSVHKWYTCHVVATNEKSNLVKLNYDEWSSKYDEWVNRDNLRIQKHMTQAKGGRTSGGVYGQIRELDPKVDDEDDPVDKDIFAVYRGELGQASFHLVAMMNEFGRAGGFDALML